MNNYELRNYSFLSLDAAVYYSIALVFTHYNAGRCHMQGGEEERRSPRPKGVVGSKHTHFGGIVHSVHLPIVFEVDMGSL